MVLLSNFQKLSRTLGYKTSIWLVCCIFDNRLCVVQFLGSVTLQAQRLKLAKEGKSPVSINPKRSLLREVGNQGVIKPSFSPRLLVGGPQRPPISSQHSPNGEFSPKRNMSPRREVNASPKSDFTNHPAFSPFTQPDSFSREQFEIESFPSKTTNQSHHLQHSNSTPYYNNEPYQRQPYSSDHQTITPNYTSDMVPAHGFHHVRQEDVRNFHPSPLMQVHYILIISLCYKKH